MNNLNKICFVKIKQDIIVPHNSEYYFEVCVSADDKINWKEIIRNSKFIQTSSFSILYSIKNFIKTRYLPKHENKSIY